ncbi:MAG: tyrosine-protein kinase family protein [Gammaproteobacteria bacterium]|nr:tyrosine-protein kinase family protein [Gammaproteobacteria bacterium]
MAPPETPQVSVPLNTGELADANSTVEADRDSVIYKAPVENIIGKTGRITHTVPLAELEKLGMVSPNFPRNRIAEEYRTIKRPLLMNIEAKGASAVKNANLIMVTSSLSGEGKTFSAVNLAISMAMEQDRTVLLVDADVTKASAARLLGIPDDRPGLSDVLEGSVKKFSDVLVHTNIPKLRVLPAGTLHEHATELLASENMKLLMRDMAERYPDRVIIFDSPPLLMTSEASVLANHMGQIMFVVAAEESAHEAAKEALGQLGKDKIVGLVLNKARANPFLGQGYGYGYRYGYGYGYGYGDGVRKVVKKTETSAEQD